MDDGRWTRQEVVSFPASSREHAPRHFDRRLVLGAAAAVAAMAIAGAAALLLRDNPGAASVVERMYLAQQDGDCEAVADSFHYEVPAARATRLDVCRQTSERAILVNFEVTDVEESPSEIPLVVGAGDVARVSYTLAVEIKGKTDTVTGSWVVAKYDGRWKIPLPQ